MASFFKKLKAAATIGNNDSWSNPEPRKQAPASTPSPAQVQAIRTAKFGKYANNPNAVAEFTRSNAPVQFNAVRAIPSTLKSAAIHNPITNMAGDALIKPAIRTGFAVNQGIGNAEVGIAHALGLRKDVKTEDAPTYVKNAFGNNSITKGIGYTGTKSQIAGDLITTGANVAMPGSSKLVTGAFKSVAPKVVPQVVNRAVANAGVGAVGGGISNVGTALSNDQIHSGKDVVNAVRTGAQFGAVLGGAGTLALPVVKAGARAIKPTGLTNEAMNKRGALMEAYTRSKQANKPESASIYARQIQEIDNTAKSPLGRAVSMLKENQGGYISIPQAKSLDMPTAKVANAEVLDAIKNTQGAQLTKDGIELDVSRFQTPEQSGMDSVRTGVFYLPEQKSANAKHYKTGKNGYGGTEAISGRTLVKNPLTVKAATGGRAPELAFDQLNGKGAYQNMRNDVLQATTGYGVHPSVVAENVYNVLEKYGADPDLAWHIVDNSKGGNTLPYAVQENIVAHAVRDAGYDSVLGYSKKRDGTHTLSELFDTREKNYPEPNDTEGVLHPDFASKVKEPTSLKNNQGGYIKLGKPKFGLTPLKGNQGGYISMGKDGKPFVKVTKDQHLFDNAPPEQHQAIAQKYLNDNFKGKTIQVDGDGNIAIGNRGIGKFTSDSQRLSKETLSDKMRLSTELDNALKVSTKRSTVADRGGRHGSFAKDGFDYRSFKFEVGGKQFVGTVNVAKNGKASNFYDIHPIKELPNKSGSRLSGSPTNGDTVSPNGAPTGTIPNNVPHVNRIRGLDKLNNNQAGFIKLGKPRLTPLKNNQAGFVKVGSDPLESLKAEARKYASADEFDKFLLERKQAGDPIVTKELQELSKEAQGLIKSGVDPRKATNQVLRNYQDKITLSPEKYKSLDEFIKSQGSPLYHGTDANFSKFSLANFGKTDSGFSGKGVYLTARKGNAKQYGKNIVESYAKLDNPLVYEDSYIFGAFSPSGLRKRLGLAANASAQEVSNELKRRGHDGIVINENTGKGVRKSEEVVVLDPSKIKTRQQLTELYGQNTKTDKPKRGLTPLKNNQAGFVKVGKGETTQPTQLNVAQNVEQNGYKASGKTTPLATPSAQPLSKEQPRRTNRTVNPEKSQNLAPDNTAPTGRTYPDNTPEIDTKQYVDDLNKQQKQAGKGSSETGRVADFKEKFIDDLAPIEDRLNKAIKNGAEVDPKDHITYQLDRSRRSEGIMNAYMNDNGLAKVIQDVPNPKEFDQYLIAKHTKELDPEITTGRDKVKDAALVKQLDGKYGEYAKQVYAYNQKLLDSAVDYGLVSKQTAAALKKKYPEYVPLNRIFKEDELASLHGNGSGNASLSSQNVVKGLKGSERSVRSPLNSIIDKTRVVVEQGERNKAAQLLASYQKLDGNPFNLKELKANETIGNRSVISFLDGGKKRVFEVDKEIADAAKNMNRQEIGMWGRVAAVPARVLRAGATGVNAGFAGANVVKDIIGAAINSRHPFRIADPTAMGKALAASLNHNGKYYQELMREGVAGTSFDMYRNPLKSNVGEIRSQKNIGTRAAYNVTHPKQWYRTVENTIGRSEDFGRALQYYSNKSGFESKLGKGSEQAKILAADQARTNSTNFFRHGSYGKGVNLAIPYWNAGVQGTRINVRRIKERPVQTVAKIGLAIAAPSAMIAMNNYSDEKKRTVMAQIEDYEKNGNIIIVGDNAKFNEKTGRWDGVTKIPVPPQHLGIHRTIQNAVETMLTGEKFDVVSNLGAVTENYTTVDPTSGRQLANKLTPQGLKLIAEPMTNTNFFTGNKIVPDSQKNLPAQDQYGDYTSGTAKTIGKLTNTSPRMIDNTIRSGAGGAGQNVVRVTDSALAKVGAIGKDEVQGTSIKDSVTNRFAGAKGKSASSKIDEQFGKLSKEVTSSDAYKNASQYDKQRMLNRLQSDISDVSYFEANKNKPKDGKEQKLTAKQNELLKGFNTSNYTDLTDKSSLPKNYDKLSPSAKAVLGKKLEYTGDDLNKWYGSATKGDGKKAYDTINSFRPNANDYPDLPNTNKVAEIYAKFESKQKDGGWNNTRLNVEKKAALREAYGTTLDENDKWLLKASTAQTKDAINNGDLSLEKLKQLTAYDNLNIQLGGSAQISKAIRSAYGLGYAPSTSSGSGSGRKSSGRKKSNIKLSDFSVADIYKTTSSHRKKLRDLLEQAKV